MTGLMGSGLGKLIWLWACILNSEEAPYTCPEQHLLGAESWAGSKINRRPGPCSRGLERGTVRDGSNERRISAENATITWQLVNTFQVVPTMLRSVLPRTPGWCSTEGLWICFWKWEPGFHKNRWRTSQVGNGNEPDEDKTWALFWDVTESLFWC